MTDVTKNECTRLLCKRHIASFREEKGGQRERKREAHEESWREEE